MKRSLLMVGNFLSASCGTRGVCEDIAVRLRPSGWQVYTTSDKMARLPRLLDMVTTAWFKRRDYALAQVDVYSGPAFFWAEVVSWILRMSGKPYILTLHGGNLPKFAKRWPNRIKALLRSADVVTTPSRYLQEEMAPYRRDLILQPNPLEVGAYHFRTRGPARPRLGWLRGFRSIYNPCLAVEVAALLAAEFPELTLAMVGPDKNDGSLQAVQSLARQLSIFDRLQLPGAVPKTLVPERMNSWDIFLNTTDIDNTPVSVLEAMASGLCVVTTNVGGIPYMLKDGHNALLVPPADPRAMAAAVRRILNDPALAERLSRNARREAEQFDWSVVLPQWGKLLDSVAVKSVDERHLAGHLS